MYIRKKKNKSGVISVQIIDKSTGRYRVLQTIGSALELDTIEILYKKAEKEILLIKSQSSLQFTENEENEYIENLMSHFETLSLIGPELLLGKLFDEIGFNKIDDKLFRYLVITRLVYPVSKLKTTDYLFKYKGLVISVYSIYRYLDKLHEHQIELVKKISLNHTLKVLEQSISVVFYDVTTLYFEASDEDDFRKTGFSKDGKHQQPQIVLGLLVSEGGYPLDYDVFEGNKYEGDTMLPVIEHFIKKHTIEKLIVVADAGLLSNKNINLLKEKNYQYILGARIKNESNAAKEAILKLQLKDKENAAIDKTDGSKLIISYKTNRAKKDAANRKKGYEKLKKKVQSGKLNKTNINNKGYNKYLKLEGETLISIDDEKYNDDAKWDGLKGYLSNTNLNAEQIIARYHDLWQIEKTFRISKTDLQIRPIYHYLKRRIEAHICISFAACKIYKELERQLKVKQCQLSPEQVIDILKTIYQITLKTPYSQNIHHRLILNTDEQKLVINLFNLKN
jgi:transposase